MNFNQLLHRHQLAQMYARTAAEGGDREVFGDLESYYAQRIGEWRRAMGLDQTGWPDGSTAEAGAEAPASSR